MSDERFLDQLVANSDRQQRWLGRALPGTLGGRVEATMQAPGPSPAPPSQRQRPLVIVAAIPGSPIVGDESADVCVPYDFTLVETIVRARTAASSGSSTFELVVNGSIQHTHTIAAGANWSDVYRPAVPTTFARWLDTAFARCTAVGTGLRYVSFYCVFE